MTPLLSALTCSSPGVSVVNIDNGAPLCRNDIFSARVLCVMEGSICDALPCMHDGRAACCLGPMQMNPGSHNGCMRLLKKRAHVAGFGAAMIAARILRIAATRTLKSVQAATAAATAAPA